MSAEQNQYRFTGVPEMFMETVNSAIELKHRVIESPDTNDVAYRVAFYEFYRKFMGLFYTTRMALTDGRTGDAPVSVKRRQNLFASIEQYDEYVITGRLEDADASTGVRLFRQYLEYLKNAGLVKVAE